MKRMQHCFWCGEELGVFESWSDDIFDCGKSKCAREAVLIRQFREAEIRQRAEDDNYER
jgi:hypothetical protein